MIYQPDLTNGQNKEENLNIELNLHPDDIKLIEDLQIRFTPKKSKENTNYHVKNADLVREIIISKDKNELTTDALNMLIKMVKKIGNNFTYYDPMDREDCEQSAIEDVLKYWRGFKPELSTNAFSYYTQVIKNGFAKGWKQLHKIKKKNMVYMSNNIWSL